MFKKPHLIRAHSLWKAFLKKGDSVIDATCGNGQDTLYLAKCVLDTEKGVVYGFDIQEKALEKTKALLEAHLGEEKNRAKLFLESHESFSPILTPVELIVYNLGYLPGGDKSLTTLVNTTLNSLKKALSLTQALSIMCYPGHEEGRKEEKAIYTFLEKQKGWSICYHKWIDRPLSPSLFWCEKIK